MWSKRVHYRRFRPIAPAGPPGWRLRNSPYVVAKQSCRMDRDTILQSAHASRFQSGSLRHRDRGREEQVITTGTLAARRWLAPSLADVIFCALFLWLMLFTIRSDGTLGLLQDSNTGYHIRTGDFILQHRAVPRGDIFSFSKPGQPCFAWEWLSAVLF